jgi:hypothetical protein
MINLDQLRSDLRFGCAGGKRSRAAALFGDGFRIMGLGESQCDQHIGPTMPKTNIIP